MNDRISGYLKTLDGLSNIILLKTAYFLVGQKMYFHKEIGLVIILA